MLPQRYKFSSKSQLVVAQIACRERCCCYHKGTNFQANHNTPRLRVLLILVVVATTKVQIFKQITTKQVDYDKMARLLLLPQRYKFSSKSQLTSAGTFGSACCCCYHKGTNFQANHNSDRRKPAREEVVVATTKVQIFKQITTDSSRRAMSCVVVATTKVQIFKQITTSPIPNSI